MAITGYTGVGEMANIVPAEIVSKTIIATARAAVVATPLVNYDEIQGSNIKSYPRFTKVTAAALTADTAGTETAMGDSQVSVTLGEVGIGTYIGDAATVASAAPDLMERISLELGKAFADKGDIDALAKASGLTQTAGVTLNTCGGDTVLSAIYNAESGDILGRTLAGFLYPKQVHQLRASISSPSVGTTSAIYGNENASIIVNKTGNAAIGQAQPSGYVFTYYGVDFFMTTNVPSANSNADSRGMLTTVGMDSAITLGVGLLPSGEPWWARMQMIYAPEARAYRAWVTGFYGYAVTAAERGSSLLSVR